MQNNVVIVAAARTPVGRFSGGLATLSAPRLGAAAIGEVVKRGGIDPALVENVIMGNVLSAGVGQAPARQAAILGGIPNSATALTINKVCASGLQAVILAAQEIVTGEYEVVIAGGMEAMSQAPHLLVNSRTGTRLGDAKMTDSLIYDGLWCPFENRHMGNSAEDIARKHGVTREAQDRFAFESHRKAVAAIQSGAFVDEIVPVEVPQKKGSVRIDTDEGPRADTTIEALSGLKPAFQDDGTVTAGNSSSINDGAAALLVMSETMAQRQGLKPFARITGYASAGNEPRWLFDAPTAAVQRLLQRTGKKLEDFDLLEVNEAFAAQTLANGKVLEWDWQRVNVKGGATALGHPIGASGARILVTLLYGLHHRGQRQGLAVICHGGGGAVALSVEII